MPDETAAVCAAVVEARVFLGRLAGLHVGCRDDRDRIDLIGVMEAVKGAAAAVQARVTADFAASQTQAAADKAAVRAENPAGRQTLLGRSIRGQIALARRDAPHRGATHLKLATGLTSDLGGISLSV